LSIQNKISFFNGIVKNVTRGLLIVKRQIQNSDLNDQKKIGYYLIIATIEGKQKKLILFRML
jgi:hypothetical protein